MGEHEHQNTLLTVLSTEQKTKCSTYNVREVYKEILVISFNSLRNKHEPFKERDEKRNRGEKHLANKEKQRVSTQRQEQSLRYDKPPSI